MLLLKGIYHFSASQWMGKERFVEICALVLNRVKIKVAVSYHLQRWQNPVKNQEVSQHGKGNIGSGCRANLYFFTTQKSSQTVRRGQTARSSLPTQHSNSNKNQTLHNLTARRGSNTALKKSPCNIAAVRLWLLMQPDCCALLQWNTKDKGKTLLPLKRWTARRCPILKYWV